MSKFKPGMEIMMDPNATIKDDFGKPVTLHHSGVVLWDSPEKTTAFFQDVGIVQTDPDVFVWKNHRYAKMLHYEKARGIFSRMKHAHSKKLEVTSTLSDVALGDYLDVLYCIGMAFSEEVDLIAYFSSFTEFRAYSKGETISVVQRTPCPHCMENVNTEIVLPNPSHGVVVPEESEEDEPPDVVSIVPSAKNPFSAFTPGKDKIVLLPKKEDDEKYLIRFKKGGTYDVIRRADNLVISRHATLEEAKQSLDFVIQRG